MPKQYILEIKLFFVENNTFLNLQKGCIFGIDLKLSVRLLYEAGQDFHSRIKCCH